MKTIFREYDIRGIFEVELNRESLYWIGVHLGDRISKVGNIVAIGYDARIHSPDIFKFLVQGLATSNLKILNMGLVPTPNNYFSNYVSFNEDIPNASIMITGSHNPPEYNGLKITIDKKPFFGDDIYKLGEDVLKDLDKPMGNIPPFVKHISAKEIYINYLVEQFSNLRGMKSIVYDVGNGVAGVVVDEVFKRLGIEAKGLFTEPDGTFPNHHPDPTEEENLIEIRKELGTGKYGIGFAYDGDGDRIAIFTQKNTIKGDTLATIFAKQMENPTIIGEVKCSQVMYDEINKIGKAIMYKTGHSNLKVKIRETDADLAAEVSGHIFFNDRYFGFDDAIYTTLRVLELIKSGIDLDDEVAKLPQTLSTDEIKIKTTEEKKFEIIEKLKMKLQNPPAEFPEIREIIGVDGVRVVFKNGWGLVRASNTTPVLVTRFETTADQNELDLYMSSMQKLLDEI
jgi:phosphomannomutase/phosphoglucomutase